jgi:hypothetical protein
MRKLIALVLCAGLLCAGACGCGITIDEPETTVGETTAISTEATPKTSQAYETPDHPYEPKLLSWKMDKNGIFYLEDPLWRDEMQYSGRFASVKYYGDPMHLVTDTVHAKFRYGPKDWIIEMRKGQFGLVMLGGEIVIATKPVTQTGGPYYLAELEEAFTLKMEMYQKNFSTNETKRLLTRGPETLDWYNGFVPGNFYEDNKKSEIVMVGHITFPDEEMLLAFEEPFAKAGFGKGSPDQHSPETYAVNGTTLTFSWQYIDQDT